MSQNNEGLPTKKNTKKIILIIAAVIVGLCLICLAIGLFLEGLEAVGLRATRTPVPTITITNTANPTETATVTYTPEPTNTPEPTVTLEPTATPEPTPTLNPYIVNRGTHLVGTDIMPGIYYGEAGSDLLSSCYWARLSDLSGEFGAILANDNSIGQFYVEVKETDVAFEVDCEVIKIDGVPEPDEFLKELEAGMYIIGRDIQPGLYKGEAGDDIMSSCYWARLRNVTGELGSIIANANATGQFFIQVAPSDFALNVGCQVTLQE